MARLSSQSEPDAKPLCDTNVVFIDTNLDTHLALIVSHVDTVSDLKKRILSEHPLCFPKIGQIQIHAIKVKRKGYFYHLSDSMFVRSAFNGFNKGWFLSVDASALGEHGQNEQSFSPGSPNQVASLGIANNALIGSFDTPLSSPSKRVSNFNNFQLPQLESKKDEKEENPLVMPCVSVHTGKEAVLETDVKSSGNNDPVIQLPVSIPELQHSECEVDGSSKGIKDDSNVCEEETLKSSPGAKKQRKNKRKKEDRVPDYTSKENHASVVGPSKDTVEQDIVVPEKPSENAGKEVSYEIRIPQNDTADGLCQDSSSNTCKRSSSRIPMSNEVIKKTEVLKEDQHTECKNNNTKNNIVAECNESMKEASEPGPTANKKHRKRKRSLIHDSKEEMLKIETALQKEEAQKSDEACEESKELKDQIEFNNDKSRDEVDLQHNKVNEEALETRPPAKKKLKGKEKSGDESTFKEKRSRISDSSVENASHHLLEDQQEIKYSSADQSTEHFDTGSLRTSVLNGRRKGKKHSSNPHQTAEVTPSRKDDETNHSRIQGKGDQEEISEDGLISKDISISKTTLDNMEIRTDACKEGIQSKVKRRGNSKSHCAIDMKEHPSDVNEPKELTEDNENIILDHCPKSEAGQTEGAEQGREVSPQNDPKPMLSEKCRPSNQDNTDANIRELTVTSKVLDVNGITEPVKSEKKRRERRKAKDSAGGPALREGIDLADAAESETITIKSLKATNSNPTSGNIETEENPLNQTEGKNVQQEKMKGTFLSATDREDDINADDTGSLEQIKTQANAEHMDKRQRKKSNNKQTSTAKSGSNMLTKDQVLDCKKPSPSSDSRTLDEPSVKIKKNKSASTKSTNKSSRTNLEPVKSSIGLETSDSWFNSVSKGSSQFPSNAPKGSHKLGPFEANDAAKNSTLSSGDQNDNNLEAPSKSGKINADQQSSREQQHEANLSDDMLVDKMNGADRTDIELMTGKNTDRLEATKGQTHAESLSSSQLLLSKEEGDVVRIHPDKKVPNVHRTGQEAKLSSWSKGVMSSIGENGKTHVNASGKSIDLEKQREHFPISNSKLESSKKMVQNKAGKATGNNIGGVVSKKSLLTGAIFKDDSSGTSEDEDEVDNSDASTRTPSDNPLLSDYSDGESSSGLSSQQNGSYGGEGLENGGRSSIKACLSGKKGMSIDHILRSSSRYKKAKITASQLEETESQPVPDSLTDM